MVNKIIFGSAFSKILDSLTKSFRVRKIDLKKLRIRNFRNNDITHSILKHAKIIGKCDGVIVIIYLFILRDIRAKRYTGKGWQMLT